MLIGRNSLEHSFAQPDVKRALLKAYDERMAQFAAVYGAGSVNDALAHLRSVHPVTYSYAKRTWNLSFP